jgi:hypothetical protein
MFTTFLLALLSKKVRHLATWTLAGGFIGGLILLMSAIHYIRTIANEPVKIVVYSLVCFMNGFLWFGILCAFVSFLWSSVRHKNNRPYINSVSPVI